MNASDITGRIALGILISLALLGAYSAPALGHFAITYYDNYNYDTDEWERWEAEIWDSEPHYCWNDEYLADGLSGNTVFTDHAFTSIATFDLRNGFASKDGHGTGGTEDWNPLKSTGDTVSGQSAHHVFAAEFTGWVYFEASDELALQSDDDAYIFLDDETDWGDEILSDPGIHYFGNETLTITLELAGYHWITVKFAERCDTHSGIQINLNGEPLAAVLAATIEIKPETLNLNSKGLFTAFIDLPEGCDEEDINISTVECEGASAVSGVMADDGRLIVKFDREDLVGVSTGDAVELVVTGLVDGKQFAGSDTIRVIDKGGKK